MSRGLTTNLIALVAVGILIGLIGMVTLTSSRLVNDTVTDQFSSQELQLVGSLAQQTEAYLDSLNSDVAGLALRPAISATSPRNRADALALMAEHAANRAGVVDSVVIFDHYGDPRYAWPETLQTVIDDGGNLPFALPSRVTDQTRDGFYVALDTELIPTSHRDKPAGTFLLVTPVFNDLRKTDLLAYEINLDQMFTQIMGVVDLDKRGQLWVIDSEGETVFQANDSISFKTVLDKVPLASVLSAPAPTSVHYPLDDESRLAVMAPIDAKGNILIVILSRDTNLALDRVESDLRRIFAEAAGAILFVAVLAMLVVRSLAREAQRRQQEVQRRQTARTLLEISRALNSTLDLEDVLRRILAELSNIVPYDSAAVLLLDRSRLVLAAHRGEDVAEHDVEEFDPDQSPATNEVLQTGRPLVIQDTLQDERWKAIMPASAIRSWMGIPLRVREKTVGVLNINSHTVGRFSPEEIELAEAFADQAGVALQNARLHEVEVKQIEQELSIAREIQTSLLPSAAPQLAQLEIAAYTLPARQVSGDYFQYLPMPNGQLGIAVGDVSGKGIPAAILMAVITTALRDEATHNSRPADLLNSLNQRLLERMKSTHVNSALFVGVFDPATRHLEIANGGMVQPYVRSGNEWSLLPVGGYPLGLSQRLPYEAKTITLAPGALLLVATDGVVEAQNAAGEMYGFERLEELLNALPENIGAQDLIDQIMAAVRAHLGDQEPQDDVTILAIRSLERVSSTESVTLPHKTRQLVEASEDAAVVEVPASAASVEGV